MFDSHKNRAAEVRKVRPVTLQPQKNRLKTFRREVDGGKIYRYDRDTQQLTEVTPRHSSTLHLSKGEVIDFASLDAKPGQVFVEAINEKNAIRKLLKGRVIFYS